MLHDFTSLGYRASQTSLEKYEWKDPAHILFPYFVIQQ
jgi:hypothetical protein